MGLRAEIENTLLKGLVQLIVEGSNRKFWVSSRATSDALIALSTCLPFDEFPNLRSGAISHLLSESDVTSDSERHWMEEVWDTSIGALALSTEQTKFTNEIGEIKSWLFSKYLPSHKSWNDELWETLCAVNAISYLTKKFPDPNICAQQDFTGAADWLISLIDTPRQGLLLNWSSTALFVLFSNSPNLPGLSPAGKQAIRSKGENCAQTLLKADLHQTEELLWTPEAWSNGLVLWAISVAKPGLLDEKSIRKILHWFDSRISAEDLPTEDRAFACVGLYKYREYLLYDDLKREYRTLQDNKILSDNFDFLIIRFNERRDELKLNIGNRLKQRVGDFGPRPPRFSTKTYSGYYSINVSQKFANVVLIVLATTFLTYLTWKTQAVQDEMMSWLVLIPIVLGTLATLAQLFGFSMRSGKAT